MKIYLSVLCTSHPSAGSGQAQDAGMVSLSNHAGELSRIGGDEKEVGYAP